MLLGRVAASFYDNMLSESPSLLSPSIVVPPKFNAGMHDDGLETESNCSCFDCLHASAL